MARCTARLPVRLTIAERRSTPPNRCWPALTCPLFSSWPRRRLAMTGRISLKGSKGPGSRDGYGAVPARASRAAAGRGALFPIALELSHAVPRVACDVPRLASLCRNHQRLLALSRARLRRRGSILAASAGGSGGALWGALGEDRGCRGLGSKTGARRGCVAAAGCGREERRDERVRRPRPGAPAGCSEAAISHDDPGSRVTRGIGDRRGVHAVGAPCRKSRALTGRSAGSSNSERDRSGE